MISHMQVRQQLRCSQGEPGRGTTNYESFIFFLTADSNKKEGSLDVLGMCWEARIHLHPQNIIIK